MVALRTLEADTGLVDEVLAEQQDRVTLGRCVFCGVARYLCSCCEHDEAYDGGGPE